MWTKNFYISFAKFFSQLEFLQFGFFHIVILQPIIGMIWCTEQIYGHFSAWPFVQENFGKLYTKPIQQ